MATTIPTAAARPGDVSSPFLHPQQQQQFFVIPQSLLAQVTSLSNANRVRSVVLGPRPIQKVSPIPTPIMSSSPKICMKRPLPPSMSPGFNKQEIKIEDDDDVETQQPLRKRANLDHMAPEDKLMRRKLKNRVAAQNARDKKRVKMDGMEDAIKQLEQERQKLKEENQRLLSLNQRLSAENLSLKQHSGGPFVIKEEEEEDMLPMSPESIPPHSPLGSVSHSSQHAQIIVVPGPGEPAALTRGLLPKGQGPGMAVDGVAALSPSAAACFFWTCMLAPLLGSRSSSVGRTTAALEATRSKSPMLPLKKRSTCWEPQQSWNQAVSLEQQGSTSIRSST